MRMRWIGAIVIAGVLLVSAACVGAVFVLGVTQVSVPSGDRIAVVPVQGQITTREPEGLFAVQGASAERIIEQLEDIKNDSSIQAVMLDINSPGGGVVASEQIHDAIVEVRDEGTPVVAYFGDTAASGGYYVAAPADAIVANPATITGSIGVIAQVPNLEELYDKLGIEMQVITSGELKDMMQPNRALTEEEREIIQEFLDENHERFMEVVAEGRDLSMSEVEELADGRIYTGRQAADNGLVDELGDYGDAISTTGEIAGLGSDPDVEELSPETPGFLDLVVGAASDGLNLPAPFDLGIDPRDVYLEISYRMN